MTTQAHPGGRVAAAQPAARSDVRAGSRLLFIDNLRIFLTILVVVFHLAITYGAEGSWFYRERPADMVTTVVLTLLIGWSQAFFMGLFFLIAGYFTPPALERKGTWGFLKDRLIRLGIPLLIYMFFFSPYVEAVKGMQEGWLEGPLSHAVLQRYQAHAFTPGPMWFVEALLIFSAFYAFGHALLARLRPQQVDAEPARVALTQRVVLAGAGLIAAGTFAARIASPLGSEWRHLMLGAFPQYVVLFAAGILARRYGWLPDIAPAIRKAWSIVALLGFIALPVILAVGMAMGEIEPFMGGLTWQALLYATWEGFFCVGMCVALLGLFRARFDHQGPTAQAMAADAYTVYFIHAPVIVTLGLLLSGVALYPLLKWAVVSPPAVALCFLLAHLVRQIPGAKRVL
jgi:surface polysaccharide O-acyltransferase-like enzyme